MRFKEKIILDIVREKEDKYVVLIKRAQEDGQEALAELFHRYWPLIRRTWQQYFISGFELADWEQEAKVVMLEILHREDKQDPRMFSGFLKRCLENKIKDIRRQSIARKRIPANQVSSLDANCTATIIDPVHGSPDDIVYCHQSIKKLLKECSPFECRVLGYIHSGYSLQETAAYLGCSKRSVQSALHRSHNKLLTVLKNDWQD